MDKQKVLIYNWAPYDRRYGLSGGVSIYCRNLVEALREKGIDVDFLYSGIDYTWFSSQPRVRFVCREKQLGVPLFSLVNSPTPAPAFLSFDNPLGDIENPALEKCFDTFLRENGPYQAVHFNNLEGLTAGCLKVARAHGARVVFSLHNYWALCPQVNLWRKESTRCTDYDDGNACLSCQSPRHRVKALVQILRRTGSLWPFFLSASSRDPMLALQKMFGLLTRWTPWVEPGLRRFWLRKPAPAAPRDRDTPYRRRREAIIRLINENADVVLAVSERTAQIFREQGLRPEILQVQYIGTNASKFLFTPPPITSRRFRIAFIGPLRAEKGIFFFLDELARLPAAELSSLEILIAGRALLGFEVEDRLRLLSRKVAWLRYVPYYSHEQLPSLLSGVQLGVVAPLWEDNLPQVVFELLSCRVPVLCSDRGGAPEFVRHADFIFDPEMPGDFLAKLRALRDDPSKLTPFWNTARIVKPMARHADELLCTYGITESAAPL